MSVAFASGSAITALMLALWLLSLARRDASIVDIFWGMGFVVVAWVAMWSGEGFVLRKGLVTGCATLWGLRLSLYLAWRNWGMGEDYRYQAMRAAHGDRFWLVSLLTVFGLQGALMLLISLPLQVAQLAPEPSYLTFFDVAGLTLFALGLGFEAVGDAQLARFKADPASRGKVMDRGLWRYTRHPNYFGDALLWWGIWLIAVAVPGGLWTIVSPLVMTGLLMRVSGVPLLERKLAKTRPEYADYVRRTSAFVPWPPSRG